MNVLPSENHKLIKTLKTNDMVSDNLSEWDVKSDNKIERPFKNNSFMSWMKRQNRFS